MTVLEAMLGVQGRPEEIIAQQESLRKRFLLVESGLLEESLGSLREPQLHWPKGQCRALHGGLPLRAPLGSGTDADRSRGWGQGVASKVRPFS